jgi:hypothetical protein
MPGHGQSWGSAKIRDQRCLVCGQVKIGPVVKLTPKKQCFDCSRAKSCQNYEYDMWGWHAIYLSRIQIERKLNNRN